MEENVLYKIHSGEDGDEWARYLAEQLNEPHLTRYYAKLIDEYPIDLIKQALIDCKKVPKANIRKSRAALFKYLLNQYVEKQNTRHS